jgi:hypothetical protein
MSNIPKEQADLYKNFFNFLSQEHNLTCNIEEMNEIIHEAQTFVKKFDTGNISESYSIKIDDVAKFRYELVKMIEKVMVDHEDYKNISSSQIAERFEKEFNSR